MSKVLVVFQANSEVVEQFALAVAVGAVEAEALIRLRRLASADAPEVGHKSYGRLQAGDLSWAAAVVVVLEEAEPNFEELDPMLELLGETERPGVLAWTFRADGQNSPKTEAQRVVEKAFVAAGFSMMASEVVEEPSDPHGRMKRVGRLAAMARAGKNL
jgi:hypothetical protein